MNKLKIKVSFGSYGKTDWMPTSLEEGSHLGGHSSKPRLGIRGVRPPRPGLPDPPRTPGGLESFQNFVVLGLAGKE